MNRTSQLLAIDIGNTRAKFGVFHVDQDWSVKPINIEARLLDQTTCLADELLAWWQSMELTAPLCAVVAGSDPETRERLTDTWPFANCPPVIISGYKQIPVGMDVDAPEMVGIDRLLNVFAGWRLFARDRAVIVVDSGTATTVDLMTADQTFRGGSILPGLRLSAIAMHDYTARLPLLSVDDEPADLPEVPGRNTTDAMRAGLFIGQLGAVRELVDRLSTAAKDQFGESKPPVIVVTGGGGRQLTQHLTNAVFIDSLALHGLAMLGQN
jgi:type III pantothenate kinase